MNYYSDSIHNFIIADPNAVLGQIGSSDDHGNIKGKQISAWIDEIDILQQQLKDIKGRVIIEYSIRRLGKRVDCILLAGGFIFVIEFKTGNGDVSMAAEKQVWGYALGLHYFHETSQNRVIVPILVSKKPCTPRIESKIKDNVYSPIIIEESKLADVILNILSTSDGSTEHSDFEDKWEHGRYNPSPTIIDAAIELFNNNTDKNINSYKADEIERLETTEYILDVIRKSKKHGHKSICFVTGVPGAGKTLVGLDIATRTQEDRAVFLSGNRPLVEVLRAALIKDRLDKNPFRTKEDVELEVEVLIQLIHEYRKNALDKIDSVSNGQIVTKTHLGDDVDEVEHIAIFDEAQRAWDKHKLCSPDRFNRKSIWLDKDTFPYSEPGFLIWTMNLKKDWGVIVCLVGGGQEINTGEAGIMEWIRSIAQYFPDWHVYISNELHEKEYAGHELTEILSKISNVTKDKSLHLSTTRRSFRAESTSEFVHYLLMGDVEKAKSLYQIIKHTYPLYLTRNLDVAKKWLRERRQDIERSGLLMSSRAGRLRAIGLELRKESTYDKVVNWFLGDKHDIESSDFLEVALGEFFVQGLELDWTAVIWDADLRYDSKADSNWSIHNLRGGKWNKTNDIKQRDYQLNGYRVILTRARIGMVIVVPEGNIDDPTRDPLYYDCTYQYLKDIGIEELYECV